MKVVLITGGAYGLGSVLVDEFLKQEYIVCFTYLKSEERAQKLKEKYGEEVLAIKADASSITDAKRTIEECIKKFGQLDVLINNAASSRDSSLEQLEYEDFDYTLKHVLYPVYNYSKCVSNVYMNQKNGKIINIGSINGMRGREGSVAYSTAKAGIEGFTKTIAKELGKYNVCCNVVAPGFIDTEGQKKTSELIKKLVLDECAIRKLTKPIEVANLVLFLASDKANNITGQVYKIDCGQYI